MTQQIDQLKSDPRFNLFVEFVDDMKKIYAKHGKISHLEVHVNPGSEFYSKFGTVCGLRVIQDYNIPLGKIAVF